MVYAIGNNVPQFSGTANLFQILPISEDRHPKLFTLVRVYISDYYKKTNIT